MLCLSGECLNCKKRVWLDKSNGCPICHGHSLTKLERRPRMPTIVGQPRKEDQDE